MKFYDKFREKYIKDCESNINYLNLFNIALSMFEYKNLPDTINPIFLEGYLISNGTVGVKKINGDLYCCAGSFKGEVKAYLPTQYLGVVVNVGTMEGTIGKDIVVGLNNLTMTPEFDILRYSDILTEIDTSERINVIFSRLLRIPKCADQKEKTAIENSIQDIIKGKITAVQSSNIQDLIGENTQNKFLDLVDVKEVDKLQYLNQYRENVIKRFLIRMGFPMQVTAKLAQQSTSEVHGSDSVAMIEPLMKLQCRKKMCEQINAMFGTNIEVEFSEVMKNNYDLIVNYVPDEMNERGVINDSESERPDNTDTE